MNKKAYQKPAMRVVKLKHQCRILSGSNGVTGVNNSDGIGWKADGFTTEENDY